MPVLKTIDTVSVDYAVPWTGKINFTVVSCSISELRRPFGQCFGHNEAMISPSIGFKRNFTIFDFYSNISSYPTPRTDFGLCRYYVFTSNHDSFSPFSLIVRLDSVRSSL